MKSRVIVQKIGTVILCVLSWLLLLLFLPVIFPLLLLLIVYKGLVNLIVHFRHSEWIPFTDSDIGSTVFMDQAKDEGKLLPICGVATIVEGDLDIERLRRAVREKLLEVRADEESRKVCPSARFKYDRLRRYPIKFLCHRYWSGELQDLDLSKLVRERRTEKTDFREFINTWMHRRFEDGGPVWEIVVYKDEDEYRGQSVLAIRMFHGMGDGYSVRGMATILSDTEAPMQTLLYSKLITGSQSWMTFKELIVGLGLLPYALLKNVLVTFLHSDALSKKPKLAESIYSFTTLELESVKRIRRSYGCKFNDVILTLVGSSLRRHLLNTVPEDEAPEVIRILLSREIPKRPTEICNHSILEIFPVPVAATSRKERLDQLNLVTKEILHYSMFKLYYYISKAIDVFPTFFFGTKATQSPVCTALGLIPSGVATLSIFGHQAVRMYGLPGQQAQAIALFAIVVTRNEFLDLTFLGNRGMFQSPEEMDRLTEYFHEELALLLQTAEAPETLEV